MFTTIKHTYIPLHSIHIKLEDRHGVSLLNISFQILFTEYMNYYNIADELCLQLFLPWSAVRAAAVYCPAKQMDSTCAGSTTPHAIGR